MASFPRHSVRHFAASGTLPQFLASVRVRAICCNHFLRNEDAVKKMLFANTRNTTTCQKLRQGVPLIVHFLI